MRALVILLALTCFAQTFAAKGTLEDVQQFTKGWLVGVFNQDVAAEATECLDLNTLEGHIKNAIEDFKKKTPEGIKDGVIELFEFFVALPKAVDLCLSEHADVIAMMKAKTGAIINLINNPDELWKQILKNTITHGITIFEDIQNGIDAINAKNWYEVGKDFGDAADLALFGTGSLQSTQDDIKNFLRGWLIGVFNTDVAGNVVECLNIGSLKDSIDRMIQDFQQKNVQGIVNGIKELFGLVTALPSAVDSCLSQHQDVAAAMKQKIASIVGYLNDPVAMAAQVLKNSLKHGFALFGDISDGISSIKSGNWQQAGTDFGDALDLALFGNTQLKSMDDVKAFLKGWLVGVFDQDVAGEVVECLDVASLEGHIQKAIEDFEQKTVQGIKDGIIELFDVFKALPGAITSCLSQHPDVAVGMVKRVKAIISYIEDPVQLGKTVLVNVFKHGVTIFKDIEQGVSAIQAGNFEEAGKDFGDALDAALFGTLTYSDDLANAGEFMRGWLIGVFDQDVAAEVTECLNLQDLIIHIDNAINDFKKGTAAGIEEGLVELYDVFTALPNAIDVCLQAHGDVAADMKNHVTTIINYIQDPSQLKQIVAKNVLLHGITIFKDVEDAFAQIKAQNWRQAGVDFGDAVDLSLFGQLGATSQAMNDFLKGFLHGFFHEDVAQELTECVEIASLEQHIANAINDFKLLTLQGFIDGFKELYFVYNSLSGDIQKCIGDHPDLVAQIQKKIQEVQQIIQDPTQLEQLIMSNIKAHGLQIVLDINEAMKNIKAAQWHQAGQDFGEVIDLILFGQTKSLQSGTIEDVEAFVKGLLVGVFKDDIVEKATDCMNLESIEQHIQNAYDYFSQFTLQGFEQGFKELLALYQETQKAVTDCLRDYPELSESVLNKIKVITQIINDPKQLEKLIMSNVQLYGTAVLADLKDSAWAIQNKQWYQAGHDIGDLVNLLIFGNKLGMSQDQLEQLAKGFLIGVFQEDVAGEVVECLKLDEVNQHIQAAIADFKQMTLDGFKNGVLELLKIYQMLPDAIDSCMTQHQEVAERMKAKIEQIKTLIANPSQIIPTIESNFKAHAFTVMKDALASLNALKSGDYLEAGKDLGETTNLLLFNGQLKLKIYQVDIKAFIQGWIVGVFQEDVAGEVVECLQVDVVYQHLQNALADFKQLNLDGFKKGALELLAIFEMLPGAINQCMTQHQDVAQRMKAKVATIQQYIQDPSQVLPVVESNFKAHAFAIIKDAAGAASSFISGNYQQAGQYLGETTNYLLFGGSLKATTDDIKAFIQGWIVGVFKEDVAGEVVECLNIEVVYEHLQAALADFQKLTIEGLEQGALEIYIVMKLLPAGIDQCMTEHQDVAQKMKAKIEQIIHYFEDPNQLLAILKANFKANIFTIIKDLADAGQAITSSNWKLAGQDFGDVTNLLLFGGQMFDTADDIKAFVKGWIIGVFKEDVAGEVVECLNLEIVNQHLQAALEDFKKFSLEGFEQGMAEIYIVMKLLPAGIDQCMSQHQEVAQRMKAKIAQIEAIIQDPSQLLSLLKKNIFAHGFTILKDIASAGESIVAKNWQQAGTYLGEALNYLLFGGSEELQISEINIKAFIKGWLIGVFKQDVAGEVVECLNVQTVNSHLQAALTDFKQHSIEGFKAGALEILAIFEILPAAVDSCLSQHQDVATKIKSHISQFVQIAQNPTELVNLLKSNVLAHGFDILDDLAHATSAIIEKRWKRAGKALGDCTNLLIFGGQRSVVQNLLQKGGIIA